MEFEFRADREAHLRLLCAQMGRSVDDFIGEAVLTFMEDYEDGREAQQVMERIERGEETTISLGELMERYALEDRAFEDRGETTGSAGQEQSKSHSQVSERKASHAA